MNVLVVDTSSWVSFFEGKPSAAIDLALREARVWLSPIVASELLSAKLSPLQRSDLQEMLAELPLCECPFEHWVKVGELRSFCSQKGFKVSTPDAHVAQCALDRNAYLISEDKIFEKISKVSSLRLSKGGE